jgi:hypothetical protein
MFQKSALRRKFWAKIQEVKRGGGKFLYEFGDSYPSSNNIRVFKSMRRTYARHVARMET